MKNLKKYLGIIGLVLAVMMLTSCKTVIGGIELKTSYVVFAILAAIVWAITAFLALLASKSIFAILSLLVAAFPFFLDTNSKIVSDSFWNWYYYDCVFLFLYERTS